MSCLLILGAVVTAVGFVVDVNYTLKDGSADFRPRVVGYRLMINGHDPYRFLWQPGMSTGLIDPYLPPGQSLTRTTVTPTTLFLNAPIDHLPYKQQQVAWLVAQWALFLGMLFLTGRTMAADDRLTFWAVCLLLVGGSYAWRLHVERGQIYVVFAFLFACVIALALRARPLSTVAAGIVLGVLIAMRPTSAFVLIPFVLAFRWRFVLASMAGCACAVALPALVFGASIWRQYAEGMSAQALLHVGGPLEKWGVGAHAAFSYPAVIDGISKDWWRMAGFPTGDSSFTSIGSHLLRIPPAASYAALCVAVVALSTFLWWAGRGRKQRTVVLLLQGGVLAALAEFFVVATKYSYRDITLVPLIALVVIALGVPWLRRSPWTCLGIIGLAMGCVSVEWWTNLPKHMTMTGEALFFLSLLALTFAAVRRQDAANAAPPGTFRHRTSAGPLPDRPRAGVSADESLMSRISQTPAAGACDCTGRGLSCRPERTNGWHQGAELQHDHAALRGI